ncbi:MAG: S8 family serine peptidase [Ignavibacteria bacterium]
MKKFIFTLLIFILFVSLAYPQYNRGKMTDQLADIITLYDNTEKVRIIVHLSDKFDVDGFMVKAKTDNLDKDTRTSLLLDGLKDKARQTQSSLLNYLRYNGSLNRVTEIKDFWIINAISAYAEAEVIKQISLRGDVSYIEVDNPLNFDDENIQEAVISNSINGVEIGLKAIKADVLWKLGITGEGTIVMNVDSGVDGNHPAFNYKWRGLTVPWYHAWYDAAGTSFPTYCTNHGSHTMGIMCGLGIATGDTVGVSFGSKWIAARRSCSGNYTNFGISAFQWGMDPDSNSSTRDEASVINCSWNSSDPTGNECNGTFKATLITLEAAGVPVVWSSGNSGPGSSSVTAPKNINTNIVNAFTVGALDGNNVSYPIASFSSRGPSKCGGTGSLLIKPEVSAPGVNVRSSLLSPSYGTMSGTSMAAPHAAGSVALLRSFAPAITGKMALLALYFSATDLGTAGEDNTYGMGMINVYNAMRLLGLTITHTQLNDTIITAGPYRVRIELSNSTVVNANPNPASVKLFWSRNSSNITDSTVMTRDTGNVYYADIAGNGTPSNYKYFIRAFDTLGIRAQLPGDAPLNYFTFNTGATSIGINSDEIPERYSLLQNYPNPFNPETNITYTIKNRVFVSLKVYDAIGREAVSIVNSVQEAGSYTVKFNGLNFRSGVYFYRLKAGEFSETKSMILLK